MMFDCVGKTFEHSCGYIHGGSTFLHFAHGALDIKKYVGKDPLETT
jgi:hypothetical protein